MSESTLNRPSFTLRLYPDPSLTRPCEIVRVFGPHTRDLAIMMFEAMHRNQGVGLAANQMGQRERLFVVSGSLLKGGPDLALFNPYIIERGAPGALEEGCLSLPGVSYVVPNRANMVKVSFQDYAGNKHEGFFEGLAAVCVQHELDHLDGLTMLDRLSALKARRVREKILKQSKTRVGL
jgi:peptide deformylase